MSSSQKVDILYYYYINVFRKGEYEMKKILALMIAMCAFSPLSAAALSISEIESLWSNTAGLRGTFRETYGDGSTSSGTFYVQDPSRMRLTYKNGAVITIANGRMSVDDPYGEEVINDLGPFRKLFSQNPDIDEIVSGTGESASLTTVRISDPDGRVSGYVDITFSNRTGRMTQWRNRTNGENILTVFSY